MPHYSYDYALLLILYHTSLQLYLHPSTHPLSYLITAMLKPFYSSFIIPDYNYAYFLILIFLSYLSTAIPTSLYSFFIIRHYSYTYTLLHMLYHTSAQLFLHPSTHPLSYLITALFAPFYSCFIMPHYVTVYLFHII